MKSKFILLIILAVFLISKKSNATAGLSNQWTVENLLTDPNPNYFHTLYVKTNSPTSVTVHVYCTRAANDYYFNLNFAIGTFDQNANGYTNTGFHMYTTFSITAVDFDATYPGNLYLDYVKTFTIDARTQSLGTKQLSLFQIESNGSGGTQTVAVSNPYTSITYVTNQGTYDTFPSSLAGTQFNYTNTFPFSKTILPNDYTPVLTVGQKIYSPSSKVYLTLQTDGNLVLRKINSDGTETSMWASMTNGKPSAALYFQTDGNLVIYPGTNTPTNHTPNSGLWGSNLFTSPGLNHVTHAYFRLQDDGNLVYIWPDYDRYLGLITIIMGAADSGSGPSPHFGNLHHPLWSPAMQQESSSNFTTTPQ